VWIVLGLLGVAAVGIVVFVLAIVFVVFGTIKSSDAYQQALARATSSAEVKAELGEPIVDGWYVLGNIEVNNDTGRADIRFPVSGPKGSGMVEAVATKRSGVWVFSRVGVQVDGGKWIDLSKGGP
jgi:hypothetical protein